MTLAELPCAGASHLARRGAMFPVGEEYIIINRWVEISS
jgi:hypothetical protein